MVYLQPSQQIRHDVPHQAADSTQADLIPIIQEKICHLYNAFLGMFKVLLVHLAHHLEVLLTLV